MLRHFCGNKEVLTDFVHHELFRDRHMKISGINKRPTASAPILHGANFKKDRSRICKSEHNSHDLL